MYRDGNKKTEDQEVKKLEDYFTKVSAPVPKRLIIESHEGGTHSITSTRSSSDGSDCDGDFQDGRSDAGIEQVLIYETAKSTHIRKRVVEHSQVVMLKGFT